MGKLKKINTMVTIKLERDIESFLQKVEDELDKVFRSYSAPARKITELGMLSQAIYSEILEKSDREEIPYPWDFYQALGMLPIVEQAWTQLSQNDSQGLAYSVGAIMQIVASGAKIEKRRAGRGRRGYEDPWTMLLKDVIRHTERENPDFSSTDVINNIVSFFDDNEYDYPSLNVTRYPNDDFGYKNADKEKPDITRKSLVTRINNLKKSL